MLIATKRKRDGGRRDKHLVSPPGPRPGLGKAGDEGPLKKPSEQLPSSMWPKEIKDAEHLDTFSVDQLLQMRIIEAKEVGKIPKHKDKPVGEDMKAKEVKPVLTKFAAGDDNAFDIIHGDR